MVRIGGIIPWCTYAILYSKGQWFADGLWSHNLHGLQPFEQVIRETVRNSDPIHLIFRDAHQIKLFLNEENPAFAQIQHVIILSQHYQAPIVLTRNELYDLLREMKPSKMVKGSTWIDTLRSVQLDNTHEMYSSSHYWITSITSTAQWDIPAVTNGGGPEYRFREYLNHLGAVKKVIYRKRQTLIEGFSKEIIVDALPTRTNQEHRNDLVVPEDWRFPVTRNRPFSRFRDIYPSAGKTLQVTVYPLETPVPQGVVNPPAKRVKRVMPFDVLAANR